MKKIFILFITTIVLVSCGTDQTTVVKTRDKNPENTSSGSINRKVKNSTDFIIETKNLSEFSNGSSIEKIGKVVSNENIDIKSQISGRISNIYIREGEEVYKGQSLAKISDLYSKYYLDLQKAEIDYEKQIINKESHLLSLEQKIIDTQITLIDAEKNLENTKITAEEDIKKAELDYGNSDLINSDSQAYLELEKAELDYDNIINSNKQLINTYTENVKKEYNNLNNNLIDIIKFSDELLGVTTENNDKNDDFEAFLGAKNSLYKNESKDSLLKLISYKTEIDNLDINVINEGNIIEFMDIFFIGYGNINDLLGLVELTLNNSISSVGSLSESDIENYLSKVNSFQSTNQGNLSSFTSTKSTINSFLNTYKNSELSALKNIELQEKKLEDSSTAGDVSYNKTIISIQNTLNSYETKYKQAKSSYDNALKNKEITIKSLDNTIASSKNSLNKASAEYSKLSIVSPISGIISSINIDNNTDVGNGTNLFTVISNDNTQIEISLSNKEISNIKVGDIVKVSYLDNILSGTIYSKSSVADSNLEYKVMIVLDEKIDLIGGSTIVTLTLDNNVQILPIELINITGDNIGYINILNDSKLEKAEIILGKIDGNNIEILTSLKNDIEIVITDLENFNELSQTLKVNNK